MIQGEHGIQCMPCSPQIISEMLPEIHTVEKFDFLRSIIYSQIISFCLMCAKEADGRAVSVGPYQSTLKETV